MVASGTDVFIVICTIINCCFAENVTHAELVHPPGQEELISAICETGKPLVVVRFTEHPIPFKAIEQLADALLMCWQLGTETGKAIANIILGNTNPSGKLPTY